jgi:hypothetical protein
MKKIIITIGLLFSFSAQAKINCDGTTKHPLFCEIKRQQPSVEDGFAMELSNLINKYSKIYKVDPYRSIAIIKQESGFIKPVRTQDVLIKINDKYEIVEGITDLSIFQFNISTIKNYKLDFERLQTDLEYATQQHFKLLKEKINTCSNLGNDAWSCYHSINDAARLEYVKLVNRWYKNTRKDQ